MVLGAGNFEYFEYSKGSGSTRSYHGGTYWGTNHFHITAVFQAFLIGYYVLNAAFWGKNSLSANHAFLIGGTAIKQNWRTSYLF